MEKINYFELFVKAIVFALITLAIKTMLGCTANAAIFEKKEYPSCKTSGNGIWIDWLGRYHDDYGICNFGSNLNQYSEPNTPVYSNTDYNLSPAYHQTHYSGVIHGPKIGDWYTIEGTSY